jgi:hypothetical protein
MSVLADIFTAPADDRAIQYDEQPDTFVQRVQFTGFTVLELSTLWAILQGTAWDVSLLSEFAEVLSDDDGERTISRLPEAMRQALTRMTSDDVSAAATKWAATDELLCSADEVRPIIEALVSLAKNAETGGQNLYFWSCV